MTIHIRKPDFKCSGCRTAFIPYKKEIKCPKCGKEIERDINEYLDFIKMIAGSMKTHKKQYGRYSPGAWYIGSMSDHIQSFIFKIFDSMENDSEKNKEKEYLSSFIDKIKWEEEQSNQKYFKDYIKEITFEVLDVYKKEDFASIKQETPSPRTRVKKWHSGWMP